MLLRSQVGAGLEQHRRQWQMIDGAQRTQRANSGALVESGPMFSMIPFALLIVLLHLVGREAVLRPKVPGRQP